MIKLAKEFVAMPIHELEWVYHSGKGAENYNKDGYQYKASMTFDVDSLKGKWVKDKCDKFWEDNKPSGKALKTKGYKLNRHKPTDAELAADPEAKGKLDGTMTVVYSTKTTWPKDPVTGVVKPKVIKLFGAGDKATGKKPSEIFLGSKRIGNGTLGSMSGNMCIYINGSQAGVTFYLDNIQIIKLVEFGEGSGFEATEGGGYEGEDMADESSGFAPPEPTAPAEEAPSTEARPRI